MTALVAIRQAVADDAEALADLMNGLNRAEGIGRAVHSRATLLRDGFGARPWFAALVAERERRLVGYTLFHDTYNTDLAAPGVWLCDLYVEQSFRGQGIGRRLMAEVARRCVAGGGKSLWWAVRSANVGARAFYARLGAGDEDARVLQIEGRALEALGAAASDKETKVG